MNGREWKEMIRQKASRELLAAFGVDDFLRKMWERFTVKKACRTVLEEAARVAQLGIDGSWQKESLYKEELEFLRVVEDLRFDGSSVRKVFRAGKEGDWEKVFVRNDKFSAWTSVKVRECYSEVEQEDEGRLSIAQGILPKSTDFLRHRTSRLTGRSHIVVCPHCHRDPLEDCIWDSSKYGKKQCNRLKTASGGSHQGTERSTAIGGVPRAAASAIGRPRTESWSCETARTAEKQELFEHSLRLKEFVRQLDRRAQTFGKPPEKW